MQRGSERSSRRSEGGQWECRVGTFSKVDPAAQPATLAAAKGGAKRRGAQLPAVATAPAPEARCPASCASDVQRERLVCGRAAVPAARSSAPQLQSSRAVRSQTSALMDCGWTHIYILLTCACLCAARDAKAAATFPRPTAGALRPVVHGQTLRYQAKRRAGRGFTHEELKVPLPYLVTSYMTSCVCRLPIAHASAQPPCSGDLGISSERRSGATGALQPMQTVVHAVTA